MKEYTNARQLTCEHIDEHGNPQPCPGYCPKLIVKSSGDDKLLGPAQTHAMAWSESELRRFLKEADDGTWDLPNMPQRRDSRFHDPLTQVLIDTLQTNPIHALAILLFLGQPTTIAFQQNPPTLALQDPEGEWLHIHLDTKLEPDQNASEDTETAAKLPEPVTYHHEPPAAAAVLWTTNTDEGETPC